MSEAVIYLLSNGKPIGYTSDHRTIILSEGEGYVLLTEKIDNNINDYYVDLQTLKVVRKSEKPSNDYNVWDYQSKQWIIDLEVLSFSIRNTRDDLLKQSDWSQGLDVPENIRTTWAVYRDALRNIPQQEGFPEQVIWPTAPER